MAEPVREIDALYGRLIRWLAAHGMETRTPMRGASLARRKGPRIRRFVVNGLVRFVASPEGSAS